MVAQVMISSPSAATMSRSMAGREMMNSKATKAMTSLLEV
jgi:hypothetical protein